MEPVIINKTKDKSHKSKRSEDPASAGTKVKSRIIPSREERGLPAGRQRWVYLRDRLQV